MSAIWGCVDLSGKALPAGLCEAMGEPYRNCKIDRLAALTEKNAAMGCALFYIHEESEKERLPIYDLQAGIIFAVDAHIFNRDEILDRLCPGRKDIPDGELFYLAYLKWGADCVKSIYGSYAFAAYEYKKNELVVGADHGGTRSVYYNRQGDIVYFGTFAESIFPRGRLPALNKKWCAHFLAISTYAVMANGTDTPYADVYRVPAANYCVFGMGGQRSVKYWDPTSVEPLRLGSDDEYKLRFRELFEKCAREALRVKGDVAIRMSSGFDSGAVAAVASRILEEQGKTLYAYTHIPLENSRYVKVSRRSVANEKEGVLRFCEMHTNIEPNFLSTPEVNGVHSVSGIMGKGFFPVKSTTNVGWIEALTERMRDDGRRIVLNGQFGNVTISRGSMETYLITVLSRGRIAHFLKTLNEYALAMDYGRKKVLKYMLWQNVPYWLRRRLAGDYLADSLVNREFLKKCGIGEKDKTLEPNAGIHPRMTFEYENTLIHNEVAMAQVSDSETRMNLHYGVQTLDITKDPRILEFCASLPMECFSRPGPETRRLVRIYLSDIYPPQVLPEKAPRGLQSADMMERFSRNWEEVCKELERVCLSAGIAGMVDEQELRRLLDKCGRGPEHISEREMKNLIFVYSLGAFIESHNWAGEQEEIKSFQFG